MKFQARQTGPIIGLILVLLLLSFLRENSMLVINGAIKHSDAYKANIPIPEFLTQLSTGTLTAMKWGLNLCFTVLFLVIGFRLMRTAFSSKRPAHTFIWVFMGCGLLFITLLGVHSIWPNSWWYFLAIKSLHFINSPLPVMILLPLFALERANKANPSD